MQDKGKDKKTEKGGRRDVLKKVLALKYLVLRDNRRKKVYSRGIFSKRKFHGLLTLGPAQKCERFLSYTMVAVNQGKSWGTGERRPGKKLRKCFRYSLIYLG